MCKDMFFMLMNSGDEHERLLKYVFNENEIP